MSSEHLILRPCDEMRRQPKQARAKKAVNAIVESAHHILLEHGRDALSTTSLEVLSGVPKSSIYQYFPNLDAIVFEVFRRVIRDQHIEGFRAFPGEREATVSNFIEWLLDWSIDIHRKILALDRQLLLDHKGFWDAWEELNVNLAPENSSESFIYEKLKSCSDFVPSRHDRLRVRALGRAAQLMVYSLITDDIDFLDDPAFRPMLANMCYGIFSE